MVGGGKEEGVAIFISRGFNVLLTFIGKERERKESIKKKKRKLTNQMRRTQQRGRPAPEQLLPQAEVNLVTGRKAGVAYTQIIWLNVWAAAAAAARRMGG